MAGTGRIKGEPGDPLMLGANRINNGYNFAVEVPKGASASLVLYHKNKKEPVQEIPFEEESRKGRVCAMRLLEFAAGNYEYNYRIEGTIVQDPCAYGLRGRERFKEPVSADGHSVRCRFLTEQDYDWEADRHPEIPYEDLILYKIHVRGYTKLVKNGMSPKKKGTFSGLTEMIPYWKELGINAVELMPAYEFWEVSRKTEAKGMVRERSCEERVNYWGYLPGLYFAPKGSYCATKEPEREVRDFIKALHRAGLECIMEFYFPAETSPLLALRALQFWNVYYHVDGFHLVGEGVPLNMVLKDGVLSGAKLLVNGYDVREIYGNKPPAVRNIGVTDWSFLEDMRRFLKSDEGMLQAVNGHIRANSSYHAVVNFMTSQDGFTMQDLVSYNYKNNEANGENNQDGSSYNYSWNCGVEGPTRKKSVCAIRARQVRNAFLMLLFCQGVPMIYGGDEFGNSQNGNNNAYCQDNPVGWTDWGARRKNETLLRFVRDAIAFRKSHSVLHSAGELKESDYKAAGHPDISFHGERAWYLSYDNTSRLLGVMYCGAYGSQKEEKADDTLYVAYNFHWETRRIALPNLSEGMGWKKIMDSGQGDLDRGFFYEREETYHKTMEIAPRTIVVLAGRQEE